MMTSRQQQQTTLYTMRKPSTTTAIRMPRIAWCLALAALLPVALHASPAVVWTRQNGEQPEGGPVHSSRPVSAAEVLRGALELSSSSSPVEGGVSGGNDLSVAFLLARGADGSESLTKMASEGLLPQIEAAYESAYVVHHHAEGLDGAHALSKTFDSKVKSSIVTGVSLKELTAKLQWLEEDSSSTLDSPPSSANGGSKRSRALQQARVVVVTLDPSAMSASDIDAAVVRTIAHPRVNAVVLSAIRSVDEVKLDRVLHHQRRRALMPTVDRVWSVTPSTNHHHQTSSRRLEEQQQGEGGDNGQNNNNDMAGVYYVNMTPNILAGILFTFLFATITFIAVSCMGMIAGQDTYVSKYPSIGREA